MKQKVKLIWRHFGVSLVLLSTPETFSFNRSVFSVLSMGTKYVGPQPEHRTLLVLGPADQFWWRVAEKRSSLSSTWLCQGPSITAASSLSLLHHVLYETINDFSIMHPGEINSKHFFALIFHDIPELRSCLTVAGTACFHGLDSLAPRALHTLCGQGFISSLEMNLFWCGVAFGSYFSFHTRMRAAGNKSLIKKKGGEKSFSEAKIVKAAFEMVRGRTAGMLYSGGCSQEEINQTLLHEKPLLKEKSIIQCRISQLWKTMMLFSRKGDIQDEFAIAFLCEKLRKWLL